MALFSRRCLPAFFQAEKKWLEKLLQLAEHEVETLARQGGDVGNEEEQAAYEDFHRRWRKAAR